MGGVLSAALPWLPASTGLFNHGHSRSLRYASALVARSIVGEGRALSVPLKEWHGLLSKGLFAAARLAAEREMKIVAVRRGFVQR